MNAIETADREDAVGEWLEDHGIDGGWDIAPTFVEGGIDTDWLERISAAAEDLDASTSLEKAIRWLAYTIESELLINQISEASKRISALVADAKQYSQMDRAPFQVADVHELLRSTLVMFADRLSRDGGKDARPSHHGGQGLRPIASRNPLLPRRSQPGMDKHHRQRDRRHAR